jgi:DNA-binding LacI/PurR family transcriptional regulator
VTKIRASHDGSGAREQEHEPGPGPRQEPEPEPRHEPAPEPGREPRPEPRADGESGTAEESATGRSVTIHDVARVAGVGRQTVSNVLNNGGRVGAAARARVLDAVEALGYQPHRGARSLRSRRTMQLAYLMPRIQLQPSNLIMLQFLQALVTAAARREYSVVVVVPEGDPLEHIRHLIASRSVDAFVLSELQPSDRRVELLAQRRVPFACFGRMPAPLPQHWVDIDNRAGLDAAAEHAMARGFTRLAYVGYRSGQYWDNDRTAGFRDALGRRGMSPVAPDLLVDDGDASEQIRSLIFSAGPTAIIAGSDRLAAVVYTVAADLGLRIGRDLAVTGFDGSVIAGLLSPRLTSVAIPVDEIADRIIDRALNQLRHGPDAQPGELVSARLVQGGST